MNISGMIRKRIYFFLPFLMVVLFATAMTLVYPKGYLHLMLNQFHTLFFDRFFSLITWLGDGSIAVIAGIVCLAFSFRLGAYVLATYAASGILVQLLKRVFFEDMLRPAGFFKDSGVLYLVEGIKMYHRHSFPSGHAATALGVFLCLAMVSKKAWIQVTCFLLAMLTAYSRVYLSLHFLGDIIAGALIGAVTALVFYYIFYRNDKKWHSLSLISLIKK